MKSGMGVRAFRLKAVDIEREQCDEADDRKQHHVRKHAAVLPPPFGHPAPVLALTRCSGRLMIEPADPRGDRIGT